MPRLVPTYSHGGTTNSLAFPPVDGTIPGAGNPIFIGDAATVDPAINVVITNGTAVVQLQCNGGKVDQYGQPPASDWVDCSSGGYQMVPFQVLAKRVPRNEPYWRTYIVSITGGSVTSYCPGLRTESGDFQTAGYPPVESVQSTS